MYAREPGGGRLRIPDAPDAFVLADSGEDQHIRAGFILHGGQDATVGNIVQGQTEEDRILLQGQGAGDGFPAGFAVRAEIQDEGLCDPVVDEGTLIDDVIPAGDLRRIQGGGNGLACCGIGQEAGPAFLIQPVLTDQGRVALGAVVEAGVADDIALSVRPLPRRRRKRGSTPGEAG